MIKKLTAQLKRDEGEVKENGRHVAYFDHLGYATIGYGRLIDRKRGGGISDEEAELLLANDIETVRRELSNYIEWFGKLNEARQGALLNMAFQLGINGLLNFKKSLQLMALEMYADAADEFLRSRWAEQTPARAARIARQISSGVWV